MISRIFEQNLIVACACLATLAGCGGDDPTVVPDPAPEVVTFSSSQYLDNKFFRLDSPAKDDPGRDAVRHRIDPPTIRIFRLADPGNPGYSDFQFGAAYLDTSGIWAAPSPDHLRFAGERWTPVEFEILWDTIGEMTGVMLEEDVDLHGIGIAEDP